MSDEMGGLAQAGYAKQVGLRLRAIRRQQGLSLQDVEALSGQEFKASVLGAYERGERVISVPRLQRLAGLYHVPVDQLLPSAPSALPSGDGDGEVTSNATMGAADPSDGVTFDLTRLAEVNDPQLAMVNRYLGQIAVRRQDFNGRVMTIRADDVRAIAGLFGTEMGELIRRLDDLRLRVAK